MAGGVESNSLEMTLRSQVEVAVAVVRPKAMRYVHAVSDLQVPCHVRATILSLNSQDLAPAQGGGTSNGRGFQSSGNYNGGGGFTFSGDGGGGAGGGGVID